MLTLDTPKEARQLKLALTAPGANLTVYATDEETIPDRVDDGGGWQQIVTRQDAAEELTVKLPGDPQRHYLVWFTSLPQDGSGYRIGIAGWRTSR